MSKKPPTPKAGKRRQSAAKKIRNDAIFAEAQKGTKTGELAKQFKLSRSAISEILNAPDAKARAESVQAEILKMVPNALKCLFDSIASGDALIARDVVRSTGALQDLKKIEVSGPKGAPLVPPGAAVISVELKLSLEERVKLLKGES